MVLFGGLVGGDPPYSDTWLWNGAEWTQKLSTIYPSPRYCHAMAYDTALKQVVLFGGMVNYTPNNETWVWNGEWCQKPSTIDPGGRCRHAMAYDETLKQLVLYGGVLGNNKLMTDTWVRVGTEWTLKTPANNNPACTNPRMVYDAALKQVVLFGQNGGDNGVCKPFRGPWVWDGQNWIEKNLDYIHPAGLFGYSVAYDEANNQVVLFGGIVPGAKDPYHHIVPNMFVWGVSPK